jgi:hypothetical protein
VRNLQFVVPARHVRGGLPQHHLDGRFGKRGALPVAGKGLGLQHRAALQPDD